MTEADAAPGDKDAVSFGARLLAWFDRHGRHDLPWQHPRSAYRVWLSEIMLQQTRVLAVIAYFERFVAALPDLAALARAPSEQVMALWSGLGYYARARHLHAAAKICLQRHGGELPADYDALLALPGIGRSTAGAVLAQAHGQAFPILDGNVKRVLARWRGIEGWPGGSRVQQQLWALSESLLSATRLADYTQALMDLGATICTRANPDCTNCPLQKDCVARREGRVATLPTPRPLKPMPRRECNMLIAIDAQGRVLLQHRHGAGVWQGLWSLPEAVDKAALAHLVTRQLGDSGAWQDLPAFEHGFSHYRLHITPRLVQGAKAPVGIADDAGWRWAARHEWPAIGLPAPVRRLLETLACDGEDQSGSRT